MQTQDLADKLLLPAAPVQAGAVISQLRQETGAKIKVEAEVPGCAERLVLLSCADEPEGRALCAAQEALLAVQNRLLDADLADGLDGAFTVRACCLSHPDASSCTVYLSAPGKACPWLIMCCVVNRGGGGLHVRLGMRRCACWWTLPRRARCWAGPGR